MWKKKEYTYCSETKEMKNYIEKKFIRSLVINLNEKGEVI